MLVLVAVVVFIVVGIICYKKDLCKFVVHYNYVYREIHQIASQDDHRNYSSSFTKLRGVA